MKISIITVTYNSADTINDCINSVINQKFRDKDQIIIDGASTDKTINLILQKKKFISKIISEPDKGIYYAMNKGLSIAKGDVIGFLNSDDFYNNDYVLSSVAKVFSEDISIDACYSDLVYVDQKDTSRIVRTWRSNQFIQGSFSKGWCPAHPTFFARKKVYNQFGTFNLKYKIAADVELTMRFLEVNKIKVKYLPEVWIRQRLGGVSNKNIKNIVTQNIEILKALKSYNLKVNPFIFFSHKLLLRSKEFLFN